MERRLAAILAADVVGYSRQMGVDEAGTMARLRALRAEVIEPLLGEHRGRLFKTTGDGFLAEFGSAVQALTCAIAIQQRQRETPGALQLRIGLHCGDVLVEGDDLFGDGVNIAARIEPLAEPGGIAMSTRVREDITGKITIDLEDIGTPELKNIAQPVRIFRTRPITPERPALSLPDKPSLVVLPFQNMSGDPEQEDFADGIVEDITTALSRIRWMFVIARNSAFTYKGRAVDIRTVGRELGVRYVLEGSIRKAGQRVRITGQLIEAATGHHLWADRFDGDLADIFDLQDRIAASVVGAIEPSLKRAEIARATAKPTADLDAYDLYLRALRRSEAQTRDGMDGAVALLRQALTIDPAFVRAKGLLTYVYLMRLEQGWGMPDDREIALKLARETIATTTDDAEALGPAGWALAHTGGDFPGAYAALDRALHLHPNYAMGLSYLGFARILGNDPLPAVGYFERALRLSPVDPDNGNRLGGLGVAYLMTGRNEEAVGHLQRATQEMPNGKWIQRHLIHALTRLSRYDEARVAAARLLAIEPAHRVGPPPATFNPEVNEERRQALLNAGIPE